MATIEAPIVAVTVFSDRARVTRAGKAQLTPGEQTLVLANLPTTIDADSVRASGRGAGVRILGVEVQQRYVTVAPEQNLAELNAQVEALRDADAAAADAQKATEARDEFLDNLRQNGSSKLGKSFAYGQAKLDDVVALSDYLQKEEEANDARQREITRRRRDLSRQIAALESRLNNVQQPTPHQRMEISVAVEAAAATEMELELTYVATGASWHSVYDARLIGSKVTLTYLGSVTQQTGEDWPATTLSLSTARPAISRDIPELDPWYIDVPRPVRMAYAPMSMAAPTGAAGGEGRARSAPADDMMQQMMPEAEIAQAEIESSGAAVTYRVARPVAVPSDGSPHRTTVTTLELDAKLDYITVPKLAEEAYLRATVRNSSRFIFLAGPVSIFHDADFVGAGSLDTVVPNEEFEMQLGVDSRIKVERKLAERTTGKSFIGNTRRIVYGYRIELTNLLDTQARVTVHDQLPLPRHEDIKVKLVEMAPQPSEQTDLGIYKWDLVIEPGAKAAIEFAFQVEHPRNITVSGIS